MDDEELARELIEIYLARLDNFDLVASCGNALEARSVLQEQSIDLIFLDIEMPMLKGTDFFKSLHHPPKAIFTTAYRNYAVEGFELNAIDYLVKPIEFERFLTATDKFVEQAQLTASATPIQKDYIFIQSHKKNIKIVLDEVLYAESRKDYIHIYLQENEVVFKSSMTAFEELLDGRFLRVHRSFLINTHKITAFTKHDIEIGEIEIPIGEYYKATVLEKL